MGCNIKTYQGKRSQDQPSFDDGAYQQSVCAAQTLI